MHEQESDNQQAQKLEEQFGTYDPRHELASYHFPPFDLLDTAELLSPIDAETLDTNKQTILSTLQFAGIRVSITSTKIGPRLTLFEIVPAPGVRIASIKNMQNDLSFRVGANVRITDPLPGRGTLGIEVPHKLPQLVRARSVLSTEQFLKASMELPVAFGLTKYNEPVVLDLAKLPHLLVAGATGQGKSVLLNALLVSLLYKKHPAELKLVLIDLNRLELGPFQRIAHHFLAAMPDASNAVVTDVLKNAIRTLSSLMIELDQRYDLFRSASVRQIGEYNNKFVNRKISNAERHRYLPYIVVLIDDFAELVSTDNQSELLLDRLAQLGRPAGIHLIISTQRPSVSVITGNIKSNFPARAAFRFPSGADSRTILEMNDAGQLQGDGDMLLQAGTELIHLQGTFISTAEVTRLNEFIGLQRGYPSALFLPDYWDGSEPTVPDWDPDALDPCFEEAARLVVLHQQGSTSLIQRKLKLGYNRSGRIIDQLEATGIVGPFKSSRAREVLYKDEYTLETFLRSRNPTEERRPPMQHEFSDISTEKAREQAPAVSVQPPSPPKRRSLFVRLFGK